MNYSQLAKLPQEIRDEIYKALPLHLNTVSDGSSEPVKIFIHDDGSLTMRNLPRNYLILNSVCRAIRYQSRRLFFAFNSVVCTLPNNPNINFDSIDITTCLQQWFGNSVLEKMRLVHLRIKTADDLTTDQRFNEENIPYCEPILLFQYDQQSVHMTNAFTNLWRQVLKLKQHIHTHAELHVKIKIEVAQQLNVDVPCLMPIEVPVHDRAEAMKLFDDLQFREYGAIAGAFVDCDQTIKRLYKDYLDNHVFRPEVEMLKAKGVKLTKVQKHLIFT
ncbi:hypothetical protein K431DRAFT_292411 [Polychaeton citri CBS 116435]|uniref:F-box domain-containing protein n=1 Tax=Polychaeton citri CBS 116435 TaxID=1314669 RepID=A0A9P4QF38_9PEZI|nr:hypothetical protein K431DRAFT_292411 [Polychaeton citri CBS 116435]